MNYSAPKLQSLLAAEFVLGCMPVLASRRFERLLESEPGLRLAFQYWQRRLNPLAENLKPLQPSKRVWLGIQNRIRYGSTVQPRALVSLWANVNFWRGFSLASIMLVIGFMLGNVPQSNDAFDMHTIAVLQDHTARPKLVATMENEGQALVLEMLTQPDDMGPGKVMQVWCVPKGGGKPMSLGLMNSKQNRFELSLDQIQILHESAEIAISVEPMGDAPMDAPTGEVMYRGTII